MNNIIPTLRFGEVLILKMKVKITRKIRINAIEIIIRCSTFVKNSKKKTINNDIIIVINLKGE